MDSAIYPWECLLKRLLVVLTGTTLSNAFLKVFKASTISFNEVCALHRSKEFASSQTIVLLWHLGTIFELYILFLCSMYLSEHHRAHSKNQDQ